MTTPEVSAIRDADRVVGLLEAAEMEQIELVVNRIRIDMVKRGDMMSLEDVCEVLAIELLGAVPDDEALSLIHIFVSPREIFYTAIIHNAAYLILLHNHPSGDPTPSEQDFKVTEHLKTVSYTHLDVYKRQI